jgi:uncharacterized membrane protein
MVFASTALALLCMAGVAIDGGNVYTAHRALQGATDLAAIAAASNLLQATAAADATAVSNGYQRSEVTAVTPGIYTANPQIPPSQRFQPSSVQTANAVQVTMTHQQPLFFASVFRTEEGSGAQVPNTATIVTQGIASVNRSVSFAIGSEVASFNGGVVNALLGATIGGQVSLSLVDYQSLASAQIDMFALANAISAQVGQVGATYGQAVGQTISTAQFLAAMQQAAPGIAPILQILANAAGAQATTVDLSRLVEFGPYSQQYVSQPEPQVLATASALQLLQAAAQVGGAPHLINLNFNAGIPGIANVTGMMTIGEPAQGTTVLAVDQIGTTVHTAQIRLFLNVALSSIVDGGQLQLPLYLEVGYGNASFTGLSCSVLSPSSTQATLNVTPGLVNGWIGNVTAADMTNYTQEPTPTPATLLTLPLIASVTGAANAQVGNQQPTPEVFTYDDIQNATVQTTSTYDFVGSLLSSLVGNLKMQVNVLGVGVAVPPGLTTAVSAGLTPAEVPVDQLITSVLQTAGLGLGEAATWVTGANCGAAKLAG